MMSSSLILFYCATISAAFAKRTLLQATSYRTITGTWYDDYQLAPPYNIGWEVKNANGNNVAIVTANSYSSYSHGPFTGDFDFYRETYYITQQFKCNVTSTVTMAYFVTFCNTDQNDYVHLYINDELATTTTMDSGTGTEYSEPALATATSCSPWEYYYIDSNYIPYVSANALWKVHFEIGVNWRSDFVALTGIALTCTPQPTPSPTPAPTTADPTQSPTTSNPSKSPTPAPIPNPTPYPTSMPTPVPTQHPTPSPTINPTRSPTNNPTPYPTMQPTRSPTNIPTCNPSKTPTTSPSNLPTMSTNMPSKGPTNAPTFSPTRAEGSVGTESDGVTTPLLDTGNESDAKGNDGKHSDWIKKILFMIIGFAVIICIVLWIFYCKMRSKRKKENAAFRIGQNIAGKRVIEMEQRDAGHGIGGAAHKSKNKVRYSPFTGRTSPKRVQNKSLHQHIIQSESNTGHQLSGLDSFMLDAVHDNDVDAIDDGGSVNIVISPGHFSGDRNYGITITPLPNSLMFAAGNSHLASDIILDEDDDDMMIMHDITAQ